MAEVDERYLRAIQSQENFGSAADAETVLMFAAEVRKARTEFLLTLEAVYRGEDVVPPPAMVLLLRSLHGRPSALRWLRSANWAMVGSTSRSKSG